jgi:hypothetical protein
MSIKNLVTGKAEYKLNSVVYGVDYPDQIIKGKIISIIESDILSAGGVEILADHNNKIYYIPDYWVFDHEPKKVTRFDDFGPITNWQ